MNSAIEWHDSCLIEVAQIPARDGEIVMDAYVHRSDGKPGETPGEGGYQRIRIALSSMQFEDVVPELPADIYEGVLLLGGAVYNDLVPLPMRFEGDASLALTLRSDAQSLTFSGTGIRIEPVGDFRFVEKVDFTE
jgi:hypothetical protein